MGAGIADALGRGLGTYAQSKYQVNQDTQNRADRERSWTREQQWHDESVGNELAQMTMNFIAAMPDFQAKGPDGWKSYQQLAGILGEKYAAHGKMPPDLLSKIVTTDFAPLTPYTPPKTPEQQAMDRFTLQKAGAEAFAAGMPMEQAGEWTVSGLGGPEKAGVRTPRPALMGPEAGPPTNPAFEQRTFELPPMLNGLGTPNPYVPNMPGFPTAPIAPTGLANIPTETVTRPYANRLAPTSEMSPAVGSYGEQLFGGLSQKQKYDNAKLLAGIPLTIAKMRLQETDPAAIARLLYGTVLVPAGFTGTLDDVLKVAESTQSMTGAQAANVDLGNRKLDQDMDIAKMKDRFSRDQLAQQKALKTADQGIARARVEVSKAKATSGGQTKWTATDAANLQTMKTTYAVIKATLEYKNPKTGELAGTDSKGEPLTPQKRAVMEAQLPILESGITAAGSRYAASQGGAYDAGSGGGTPAPTGGGKVIWSPAQNAAFRTKAKAKGASDVEIMQVLNAHAR